MLGTVLTEALRSGQGSESTSLAPAEYNCQLEALLARIALPIDDEYQRRVTEARQDVIAKGLSASLVDVKAVELEVLRDKEENIKSAAALINECGDPEDHRKLFSTLSPLFNSFPKARIAKITRELIDAVNKAPALQIKLCEETIEWCKQEDRSFLRHRLQTKLASLYCESGRYQAGLALIPPLLAEVKKLDDKLLLVEINLIDSKLNYAIRNIPRAKGSLTASKANANAINCPQALQAQMDSVAGMLHAEEGDFKTAHSYFFEAYEAYTNLNDQDSTARALMYLILSRILSGSAAPTEFTNAPASLMEREDVKSVVDIANNAWKERSLEHFEAALQKYKPLITQDQFLSRHIAAASDQLLVQAILKVVEPYSEVEIDHIAAKTRLSRAAVEQRLSQMILDHQTDGILDQKRGVFILYEKKKPNTIYEDGAQILADLKEVVQVLATKIEDLD